MDDLPDIVAQARRHLEEGRRLWIGTVVGTRGSTYRSVGARLLMDEALVTYGSISGGCLEGDLAERTLAAERVPFLTSYDLAEETMWSLGIGCNGSVDVLVEEVTPELLAFLNLPEERRAGARRVDLASGQWEMLAEVPEHPSLGEGVYVDVVRPRPMVYVFGAGHDAVPLVALLQQVGFAVTVVDMRPAYLTAERFPGAALLLLQPGDASFTPEEGAFAVVMQHQKERDEMWLRRLLTLPFRYIGCLGPRSRTQDVLQRIGGDPADARLHYPVGLDIGAELPEAVAVSIVAECLAVLNGREGGFLRRTERPIHA
jgi:xanthine dehydrogenase accessory factor